MRGLVSIPSANDLLQAYNFFLGKELDCSRVSLYSQWCRFDPRLAEIWVKWVSEKWPELNPLLLRSLFLQEPWPNSSAVLSEFIDPRLAGQFYSYSDYRNWKKLVFDRFKKSNFEQYFIGQRAIGGKLMLVDAVHALPEYLRWGYLSRELLWNKKFPKAPFNAQERVQLCKLFLETHDRITTREYRDLTQNIISVRQAERDLAQANFLTRKKNTRGAFWVLNTRLSAIAPLRGRSSRAL